MTEDLIKEVETLRMLLQDKEKELQDLKAAVRDTFIQIRSELEWIE